MRDVIDFAATFLDLDSLLAQTTGKGARQSIKNTQGRTRIMMQRIPPPTAMPSIM